MLRYGILQPADADHAAREKDRRELLEIKILAVALEGCELVQTVAHDALEMEIEVEVPDAREVDEIAFEEPALRGVGQLQLNALVGIEEFAVIGGGGQLVFDEADFLDDKVADDAAAL